MRASFEDFGGLRGGVAAASSSSAAGRNSNGSSQDEGTHPILSPTVTLAQPLSLSFNTVTTVFSFKEISFSSTASKSKTMKRFSPSLLSSLGFFSCDLCRPLADPIPPPRSMESVVKLRCPVAETSKVGRLMALCVFIMKPGALACAGKNGAGVMSVKAMLPSGSAGR